MYWVFIRMFLTGRSNSPSEDSGGTGDELQSGKKKRRSFRKKIHSPDSVSGPGTNSANYSDSDIVSSPGIFQRITSVLTLS